MEKNVRKHVDVIPKIFCLFFSAFLLFTFSCSRLKYEEIMEVEKKIEGMEAEAKKYAVKKYKEVVVLLEEVRSFYARRQKLKAKSILNRLKGEINNLEQEINRIKKKEKESETTGMFQQEENIDVGTEERRISPEGEVKEKEMKLMEGSMLIIESGREEKKEVKGKTPDEIFGEEFNLESLLNKGKKEEEKKKKREKGKKTEKKRSIKKVVRKISPQEKDISTTNTKKEKQIPQPQKSVSKEGVEKKGNSTEEIPTSEKKIQQEEVGKVNAPGEIREEIKKEKEKEKETEETKVEVEQTEINPQKESKTEDTTQESTSSEETGLE